MQAVIGHIVGTHRLEGAGTDVQRDRRDLDALRTQAVEQRVVEMQAGGRRRHRPRRAGIDCLIALTIERLIRAIDVRRQRHVPDPVKNLRQSAFARQFNLIKSVVAFRQHGHGDAVVEVEATARRRRFAGAQLHPGAAIVEQAFDQQFHAPAGLLGAQQARRQHACIVDHEQVVRAQQGRQVGELEIATGAGGPVQRQQAAFRARRRRLPGDLGQRQIVIKVGSEHERGTRRTPSKDTIL